MSDSYIKCIDYQGQELWKFGKCLPDGSSFHPYSICTNHKGNVFVADPWEQQVVIIRKNLELQILFKTPGQIQRITWCDQTQKLYVLHVFPSNDGSESSVVS